MNINVIIAVKTLKPLLWEVQHLNAPLVDDILKLEDGAEVQISKCPNGHGKIKSPMCCGEDMSCKIG